MEKNNNIIEVSFKDGTSTIWHADKGDWDDYTYDGNAIIIKKNGAWVGIYNFECIRSVVVK